MNFTDLAPYVQPEAPGSALFNVERAVREACIEFCEKTGVWRLDPLTVAVATPSVVLPLPPAGAEYNRIVDIQRAGQPLTKANGIEELYASNARGAIGAPFFYFATDNDGFFVSPTPDKSYDVQVFLSLKPTSETTTFPDTIGKEYRDIIATGAKSKLLLMNAQPWSNPQLGMVFRQDFQRGIGATIRQVKFGFSGASLRVRPRDFI